MASKAKAIGHDVCMSTDTETGRNSLSSSTLGILIGTFVLACLLGYLVVRDAVNKTVEHQALALAEVVATQASVARSVYATEVAAKLSKDGFGPSVDSASKPGHVPIPAQFLKLVGRASSVSADKLYEYKPVSKWNLEPSQGLSDDFLRWAWPQLEAQDQANPKASIAWKPVSRFEVMDGRRVLRYLSADPTSQPSCAACHNAYEKQPEVLAMRVAQGVPEGKAFAQHQLMGALSITIPLDKAERIAGAQINEATIFFFGILLTSFLALLWFNWRLVRQGKYLREKEVQLAQSEAESRSANALLEAKQGVEQAFAELSSYMRGIDQHAIVSVANRSGRIVDANDKFIQISGYTKEELIGQDHSIVNSGTHSPAFFKQMWSTIFRGDIWRGEICNRSKSGELYWVDSAIVPLRDPSGEVVRFISVRIDITDKRRHEDALHYQATHDGLTALPNRVLLLDRIAQAVSRAKRDDGQVVVYFIDLDKFKQINDSLGHAAGDFVLCEMARRLKTLARDGDTVARLGGDEFVVVCEDVTLDIIESVAQRIKQSLSAPVEIQGDMHTLGGSVGVAIYPDHGNDTETLIQRADIAMYQAKAQRESGICYFSPEMQDSIDSRVQMESRLREGIGRGELLLHYQPQVDFATGTLVSLEALVRWKSPQYGLLMPGQFIPMAEESNLIAAIDDFVLDAACKQMHEWHGQGFGWIKVAVNLAATKFSDPNFKHQLKKCMAQWGVPVGFLELEVTESLSMRDPQDALVLMRELKEVGVLLAIDDFGTGYSNLGYLKGFPADRLKIDQSFVRGMLKSQQDRAIVTAVIQLAHNLNMRAIAEGVETEEDAILLYSLNVDEIQGYWIARPQPAEAVEKLFSQSILVDPAKLLLGSELPTVLLVEDEPITQEIMANMLESFGVKVVCASSAEQAVEHFHQHSYEVAIVDHWLPGETGINLLAQIRKLMPQTVRVLVTASSDPQMLRDAINIGGASHFLSKPIDRTEMKNIIVNACWNNIAKRKGLGNFKL